MVTDYYNMPLVFEDCNSKYFEGEFDGIVWEFNGFGEYIGFPKTCNIIF
jgi:hypothetical protein